MSTWPGIVMSDNILIVNDNTLQRQLMRFQLEKEGFNVITAVDGKGALNCLQNRNPPSLVISDIDMPDMNGWELLQLIRNSDDPQVRDIPFVAASAFYSPQEAKSLGNALGATATISIPYKVGPFINQIKQCLAGQVTSERGTVLFDLSNENLDQWQRIFEINGLKLIEKNNKPETVPDIVVIEEASLNSVAKFRKKYPQSIIVIINRSQSISEINFLKNGASLVFDKSAAPFYVCMLTIRELERRADETAREILRKRSLEIDKTGIKAISRQFLFRIFSEIDALGVVLLKKDDLTPLFINSAARIMCAEAGKLKNSDLLDFLKKNLLSLPPEDFLKPNFVNIGRWSSFKTLELTGREFNENDNVLILVLIRDITSQQRHCHELMQRAKMDSILVMAGGIAHNLNNILMSISGFTQLLELKLKSGEIDTSYCGSLVDKITHSVDKAALLISKMIKFSGPSTRCTEQVRIDSVLKDVIYLVKSSFSDIELVLSIKRANLCVRAFASELENVFANIILNAAAAMNNKGKIKIMVGALNIEKKLIESGSLGYIFPGFSPKNGKHVFVSIEDYGHGISEDALYSIFEPYFTTKVNEGYTGLGLAVCYTTVKSFDGFIAVETEVEKGSTFTVYLPMVDHGMVSQEIPSEPEDLEDVPGLKCLVVEDDQGVRYIISDFVQQRGGIVKVASNGVEAMELLKGDEKFDVILLDINMPMMDGIEFLQEKQKMSDLTPVIIITGRIDSEVEEQCYSLGASASLKKPFRLSELSDVLAGINMGKNKYRH